jgi:CTP:molybdopterin cytidylyltransferase MocA
VNRDAESIIVLSVDQPRPAELTRKVLEAHTGDYLITRAVHEGRGGHPIVVAGSLRPELMAVNDATGGLKAMMRAHGADIHDVECGPECLVDVNTPDDFSEARSAYGATRA